MYVKNDWFYLDNGDELMLAEYGLPSLKNSGLLCNPAGDVLWTETGRLTPEQRKEIAAFMIERWQEWAEREPKQI
jgi:hypothetical protein